jgi:hypothetical protein
VRPVVRQGRAPERTAATPSACGRRVARTRSAAAGTLSALSAADLLGPATRPTLPEMSETTPDPQPAYHLFLDGEEIAPLARAVRLLIAGEAHEPLIRGLAREVLAQLEQGANAEGKLTVTLSPEQMKITHTAAHLLLDDLQREQAGERELLRRVLEKLPDEHTMRAIELP